MKARILVKLGFLFLVTVTLLHAGENPSGRLLIIGGGERTEKIMSRFIDFAKARENGKILILPMASSIPDTVGMEQREELRSLGAKQVEFVIFNRQQATDPATLKYFDGVTGVFLSGGDQSRLASIVVGTPVQAKLLDLYRRGAIVSGTSAGAAIMSKTMITGDELLRKDTTESFAFVRKGNIKTEEGLGFLEDVIIDQHFLRRKRYARLLSVTLEYPKKLGVGIDESTGILVSNGREFEVLGTGGVMVLDASRATNIRTDSLGNLSGFGMRTHILMAGDRFDMVSRRAFPAKAQK
jgi:cyanophycinase